MQLANSLSAQKNLNAIRIDKPIKVDGILNESLRLFYEYDIIVECWRLLAAYFNWLILNVLSLQVEIRVFRGESFAKSFGKAGDIIPVYNFWAVSLSPEISLVSFVERKPCCLFEPVGFPLLFRFLRNMNSDYLIH